MIFFIMTSSLFAHPSVLFSFKILRLSLMAEGLILLFKVLRRSGWALLDHQRSHHVVLFVFENMTVVYIFMVHAAVIG